jgi:hypothetical protein
MGSGMSQIDAVNELITAVNFDRFEEIEACHDPAVSFHSFRGPILNDSIAVGDWHRQFQRNYADLSYTENEYIEQGNVVAVRTTLTAKGYDWRPFEQRAVDVFVLGEDQGIVQRRLYAMLRDIELDRPVATAHSAAMAAKGGAVSGTKGILDKFYAAVLAQDADAMKELLHDKAAIIDSVYGIDAGPARVLEILTSVPRPAFGVLRVTGAFAGENAGIVELSYDAARPRVAHWVRILDGKVALIEVYWMLREIGMNPFEEYSRDRHRRQVILPI